MAIRSNGTSCNMTGTHEEGAGSEHGSWTIGVNARYFRSYKHFAGKTEQHERREAGTEVINYNFTMEVGLTPNINNRWSLSLYAPVISNVRSSMYEHHGNASKSPNARGQTRSFGIGDLRAAAYYWLVDPMKNFKANVQVGAGIKLPTGDYRYSDYFP